MRYSCPIIKNLIVLLASVLCSVALAQNDRGRVSDNYVASRSISFTSGSRSQWCSLSWNGVQLKVGMKIKYRLDDPDNCITSYLLNNFNGWTSGDRYPNIDYVDTVTEEMLNTPHGIGFYTRVAVRSGSGTFYYTPDFHENSAHRAIRALSTNQRLTDSSFESLIVALDKIRKEPTVYQNDSFDVIITIEDQASFDNVKTLINEAIKKGGKSILVQLKAAELYYSEKHFLFTKEEYPKAKGVRIKIQGYNGGKLVAAGNDYTLSSKSGITKGRNYWERGEDLVKTVYLSEDEELINYGGLQPALGVVEAVSFKGEQNKYVNEAKLKINSGDFLEDPSYIIITTQYQTCMFPVIQDNGKAKIEDGYIHFYASPVGLANHDKYYTKSVDLNFLNRDYSHGNVYPRYRLVNGRSCDLFANNGRLYINKNNSSVHECLSQTFMQIGRLYGSSEAKSMSIEYSPFKSIEVTGLTFIGNADYGCNGYNPEADQNALFRIDAFKNEGIFIHDNTFKYIRSKVCSVGGYFIENNRARPSINRKITVAQRIVFSGNKAYSCYRSLVSASTYTKSIYCIGNYAKNMNRSMYYEGVFNMVGRDFLISRNHIEDFAYSAVRSGVEMDDSYKTKPSLIGRYASEGIVEHNEFGWSEDYLNNRNQYALMDCGAIYTYCRNARLIIRDNYVYNYQGMSEASSGIYIDGYAENVKVYRNTVVNCKTTSIRFYRNENDVNLKYRRANNNLCAYNLVTSKYYFTAYDNSVKGINYVLQADNSIEEQNIVVSPQKEDDYYMEGAVVNDGNITLPASYMPIIQSLKLSEGVKAHILLR